MNVNKEELIELIKQVVRNELANQNIRERNKGIYAAKEIAPIVGWWLYTRGFGAGARVEHKYKLLAMMTGYSLNTFRNYIGDISGKPKTIRQQEISDWLDMRLDNLYSEQPEEMQQLSAITSRIYGLMALKNIHKEEELMWTDSIVKWHNEQAELIKSKPRSF